jgi:hypothetical protein
LVSFLKKTKTQTTKYAARPGVKNKRTIVKKITQITLALGWGQTVPACRENLKKCCNIKW